MGHHFRRYQVREIKQETVEEEEDVVKSIVKKFMSPGPADQRPTIKHKLQETKGDNGEDAQQNVACPHSPWELYWIPCTVCNQLCNCVRVDDDVPFMDILVMTLDGKVYPVSKELVRASVVLSEGVKEVWAKVKDAPVIIQDKDLCEKGNIIKKKDGESLLIFFNPNEDRPSIGLPVELLQRVELYIQLHLQAVEAKRNLKDENDEKVIHRLECMDWERKFFDVRPESFVQLLQANLELLIWDLHIALMKWMVVNTGIPKEDSVRLDDIDPRRMIVFNSRARRSGTRGRGQKRGAPLIRPRKPPAAKRSPAQGLRCKGRSITHTEWGLYLKPCQQCLRFCNCNYKYFPKSYPDVYVRSLDKKIVRLSGEFVRASITLRELVDKTLKSNKNSMNVIHFDPRDWKPNAKRFKNGKEDDLADILEMPRKRKVLMLCDPDIRKPTLGVTEKILEKMRYFVNMHLDDVDRKVETEKRWKFHFEEIIPRHRDLVVSVEHIGLINTFSYEDWEEKLFAGDSASFIDLLQANNELKICDLHWALQKWTILFRGTPRTMVNGFYDIFQDSERIKHDSPNSYGLYNIHYHNPHRQSRHRSGDYPFEFRLSGPPL